MTKVELANSERESLTLVDGLVRISVWPQYLGVNLPEEVAGVALLGLALSLHSNWQIHMLRHQFHSC